MFYHGMNLGPLECLMMLFVFALAAGGAVLITVVLTRAAGHSRKGVSGGEMAVAPETPLEVLRRRLAAGEITPEQFDDLRRRLES